MSSEPPVNAGKYRVTAQVEDTYYTGVDCALLQISQAPLLCRAEDQFRDYLQDNPPFTIHYEGFLAGDSAADITAPTAFTSADRLSPVCESGYEIVLQGGIARNYQLELQSGILKISKAQALFNEVLLSVGVYGMPLKHILIMGYALSPDDGSYLPGIFVWDQENQVLPAGLWQCFWHFIPDDSLNYQGLPGSSLVTIEKREVRVVAEGDFNDFLKDITRSQKAGNKTYKDFKKAGFISTGLADKMFNAQSSAVDTLDKDLSTGNYINPIDYDPTLQMDGRKVQLPIVENSNEVKKQRRAKAIQMSDDIATICTEGRNYGTISKTIDQNMDEVAGKNQKVRKAIDNVIINPFYTAKTNYVNDITKYRDVLLNDVTKKYGITQGTKLSAALKKYAEGKRVVH
ncbi:MAG: hypothetical protein EOM64_10715, partial [Erysipelotrichia bacterium]|nr:hypothetical protein [Erysipelotrichia bacterium]